MRIVTNILGAATAAALALAICGTARAGDEEFPLGSDQPGPGEEVLPVSEEMDEEEIDVLKTLDEIDQSMKAAESLLSGANSWKATDAEGKVVENIEKFLLARDLQEKAIREMSKIFDGSRDGQQKSIDGIEKLIRAAKEQESSQSTCERPKNEGTSAREPKSDERFSDRAKRLYTANDRASDEGLIERDNLGGKWGDLPDSLREELSQAAEDFKSMGGQFSGRLHEYWRVIGSVD